jgi:hypothetical protein
LAKELTSKFNIPFYELDNVVWIRNGRHGDKKEPKRKEKII